MFQRNQSVKITREFLMILDCFFRNQERWLSGVDIMHHTQLQSGTVYPLVVRMAKGGWLRKQVVSNGKRVFMLETTVVEQAKDMLEKNTCIWCASQ